MPMGEYQSNSHRSRETSASESKKKIEVEKVVSGKVKTKKKSGPSKFVESFISEDAANIKSYLIDDLAVPTLKKFLFEAGRDILEMALFGRTGGGSRRESGRSRVSYGEYYDRGRERRDSMRSVGRNRFDYDELIFETRGEAERVYDEMCKIIKRYNLVTVAAMYDLADVPIEYTANNYGWTNLNVHEPIKRVHDGYILNLPKAMPID